jgi:hypothetical protein
MKKFFIIILAAFIVSTVGAQTDTPIKKGMPNTVKLPSGEVVYDLNGEWDATFDTGGWGILNGLVKFTQKGNQFVGVVLNDISNFKQNEEIFKGKLKGNAFEKILFYDAKNFTTWNQIWILSEGEISKDGNKISIKRILNEEGATTIRSWTLNRK